MTTILTVNALAKDVELEMDPHGVMHSANTSMHLNREQVAALLPILQRFVETGDIDEPAP
jgi:hypothetical protein